MFILVQLCDARKRSRNGKNHPIVYKKKVQHILKPPPSSSLSVYSGSKRIGRKISSFPPTSKSSDIVFSGLFYLLFDG